MKVKITDKVLNELESRRVYFRPHFHYSGSLNKVVNVQTDVFAESYARIPESFLTQSQTSSIGAFSYVVQGASLENVVIGRFCSIATNVRVMSEGHPTDRLSTSTWSYGNNIASIVKDDFGVEVNQNRNILPSGTTTIGDDVWIGENTVIKRGVKIGTGAIIAGNSLVVKDVLPYEIVGGNPAKRIKFRFDQGVISDLLDSTWWKLSPAVIAKIDFCDVSAALKIINLSHNRDFYEYQKFNIAELVTKYGETV